MVKKKEKSAKGPKKGDQEGPTTSAAYAAKITTPAQGDAETGIWGDARFQHLMADPRFKGVPKVQRKVKIDKRFQGMFTDDKFKVKYTVDKYGRPVNTSNAEDLRKFYELDENDSDEEAEKEAEAAGTKEVEDEEQKERRAEELAIARVDGEKDELENDALESDGSEVPENLRERLTNPNVDYARGEGRLMTDSSSDDDTDDDEGAEGPELQIDHVWGELDNDAETTEESTRRLAICNMDWDRIRAEDLMVLLSSFLPLGGSILSVKIYPSEYGKARLAEEEIHGPAELVKRDEEQHEEEDDSDEELVKEQDSDVEEGADYHMEKLRQYQLNRLRYYYAVAECDSVATADKVYKECDGIEYESSATRVDLRFIPDDTSFEEDTPKDECSELPDASNYKPRQFTTTALQQAKVDLTWDETALDRRELGDKLSSGQVDKLTDKELRQIVAYSSEEDEDEEEEEQPQAVEKKEQQPEHKQPQPPKKLSKQERIASYKNLLADILQQEKQDKEHKYEMEMSWNIEPTIEPKEEQQKTGTGTAGQPSDLTPIEKVIQKRSEKNKLRKELRRKKQIEARGGDSEDSDDSIVPDGIDMNDAYFAEEFANGDYEPPKTKKQAKKKNKKQDQAEDVAAEQQQQQELALLLDDGDGLEEKQHFSLTKILKQEELDSGGAKRKRRKQLKKAKHQPEETAKPDDDFHVDLNDTRFKAVYKSHEYNIDPTHSHYKATKGMQQIIGEKLKRRERQVDGKAEADTLDSADESLAPKRSKQQLEQSALVKSLKRKLQQQHSSSRSRSRSSRGLDYCLFA
ncbi:LOW QUALITY PROTEIN: pre-rRNA-processing protein esf1 [Drosophila obscura]|uniref:LOW QUALITY PROTEIN: pre-rRNA-processing protein esf1 n=1 Tax=Drosophila obscura TaxID=7282 RepID=UPI001BB10955|nr:LOW QUALITY PROTEIN: pre-rRNA-processing protein esf1 [Drosophila obscura]